MLTERQIQLLEAIIQEYIESAQPVGSSLIVEKYNLNCSAATVRNEMARLLEQGYLQMEHTSSGRIPTPVAYKLFLQELMEEEDLDVLQEIALKQRLWSNRYEFEKMLRQATFALSDMVKELVVATSDSEYVISAGAANLLDNREFWEIDTTKAVLGIIDRYEILEKIFGQIAGYSADVAYLIGEEIGYEEFQNCGIVFSKYVVGKRTGHIGVIGPARMNYQVIVPAVRHTKNLVEELGGSW